MRDLLEIEMWPEYNSAHYRPVELKQPIRGLDFFACYICRRIRCASKFSNAMMEGKRGKLGNGTAAEKAGRFCIPCEMRTGTCEVAGFSIEGLRVATGLYVTDIELSKKQDSNL